MYKTLIYERYAFIAEVYLGFVYSKILSINASILRHCDCVLGTVIFIAVVDLFPL